MGDIALRGNRLTFAKGGRAAFKTGKRVGHKRTGNTQRENRLEELGRVDAEKAWTRHGKRDLRLEKHRIRDELKKGGKPWGTGPKPGTHDYMLQEIHKRKRKAAGGRIGLKKGGSDKKWIQKAVNPKHKGYCTPMTKKTCTPRRKALARTFKKKAKTGW
jgi:hypothetical protein